MVGARDDAFPTLSYAMKNRRTWREKFLAELEAVVPWIRLTALFGPHYLNVDPRGGRPPMPLETVLRVYYCDGSAL